MATKTVTNKTPRTKTRLKSFFGFTALPFTKDSDPDHLFQTEMHTRALDRLRYLLDRRGTGAIFGSPGSGKSLLLNSFIRSLGKAHYAIAYVTHTTCATRDLYRDIARGFAIDPMHRKIDLIAQIKARIQKLSRDQKIQPLLVIDEAHLLPANFLDELRILTSFDRDTSDDLTLILAGHPQLETNLRLAVNEAFAQRIVLRIRLRSLHPPEVADYLAFRLARVGRTATLFLPDAIEGLARASRGIPRIIDRLAEHSLLIACRTKVREINAEIVTDAIDEVDP